MQAPMVPLQLTAFVGAFIPLFVMVGFLVIIFPLFDIRQELSKLNRVGE